MSPHTPTVEELKRTADMVKDCLEHAHSIQTNIDRLKAQNTAMRAILKELVTALMPEYVSFSLNGTLAEPVNRARALLAQLEKGD